MKESKSVVIKEKRVKYGFQKYADPNQKTIINKERILNVNGKKVKEVQFKTVQRKAVEASNKLPIDQEKWNRKLSKWFIVMVGSRK